MPCSNCARSTAFECRIYIAGVDPASGVSTGDTVTITGGGFATGARSVNRVVIDGLDSEFVVVDDNTISVTVPAGVDPGVAADVVVMKGGCRVTVPGGLNHDVVEIRPPVIEHPLDGANVSWDLDPGFDGTGEPGATLILQAWDGTQWLTLPSDDSPRTIVVEEDGTWGPVYVVHEELLPGTNPYSVWDETHSLRSNQVALTVETAPAGPMLQVTLVTTVSNQLVEFALGGCGAGNSMDWGDGTVEELSEGEAGDYAEIREHTYATPGTYQATYTGTVDSVGSGNQDSSSMLLVSVDRWDAGTGTTNASSAFSACQGLISTVPPPPSVTNMSYMFYGALVFNQDISAWDTSSVTNMSYMFQRASAFNQDLSAWDTSSVTNMASMFSSAAVFNGDISAWDTSSVTNMGSVFSSAAVFNRDISAWDTSSVTNMASMFYGAAVFNQDISAWDTSSVTTMYRMFYRALEFNQDLSGWDVAAVTNHGDFNTNANPEWVANEAWQPQWVS